MSHRETEMESVEYGSYRAFEYGVGLLVVGLDES